MSWLSKWWRSSGREEVERQVRDMLLPRFKLQIVTRLRVLLVAVDGLDTQTLKAELTRLIEEVEAW